MTWNTYHCALEENWAIRRSRSALIALTVFELKPTGSGWMQTVLHSFTGLDRQLPIRDVIFDGSGNMFGTVSQGASYGAVWEITR